MENTISFGGSIPEMYESHLGTFLFDPFATDMVARIDAHAHQNILELACGTGCVTKQLAERLSGGSQLTATDLNPAMLSVAQRKVSTGRVHWAVADMTNLPYGDEQFGLVICQFGLMLVGNKAKALSEIRRVLKNGGKLIFSVWGHPQENQIWRIGMETIRAYMGDSPIPSDVGPFSMHDKHALGELLETAGFAEVNIHSVAKTGVIDSAEKAAIGFIEGLPLSTLIRQKDPALIGKIEDALAHALSTQLGDKPMRSLLHAWVVEAVR